MNVNVSIGDSREPSAQMYILPRKKREVFERFLCVLYSNSRKKAHVYGITFSLMQALLNFTYAASCVLGAWLIEKGRMQIQQLFL